MGQERERLFIAHIHTRHPDDPRRVGLRRDIIIAVGGRIEPIEREKLGCGREERAGKGIGKVPPKRPDRHESDAAEIVLEPNARRLGRPRFDARVVHRDPVRRARRIVGIRQGDAARVLVEVGPADGVIIGGAGDQILADVVADVDAGEESQVLLVGLGATLEEGEFGNFEWHRGDGLRQAVGTENRTTLGIAPDVQARVGERSLGLDVGLFRAHPAHDLQPAVEERYVAAEVGRGHEFRRILGIADDRAVSGVLVERELRRIRAVVVEQAQVAHPVGARESVRRNPLRIVGIEEGCRDVVVAHRRGAAAPIAADEGERRVGGADIAHRLTQVEAGLQREGHLAVEIAGQVAVGAALNVRAVVLAVAARGERVVGNIIRIHRGARGGVRDADHAGPEIKDVRERHGHAGAARDGAAEEARPAAIVTIVGLGKADSAHGFPDRSVVSPEERRHHGAVQAVTLVAVQLDLARTDRGRGREVTRQDRVDIEHGGVVLEPDLERRELETKRDPVDARQLVVERHRGRVAGGHLRRIEHGEAAQVRAVERRVRKRRAVGRRAAPSPRHGGDVLGRVLRRVSAGKREAEALVHGRDIGEIETRVHVPARRLARRVHLLEVAGVVAHHDVNAAGERRLGALE